jgi:PAS domain S-box-containing protein
MGSNGSPPFTRDGAPAVTRASRERDQFVRHDLLLEHSRDGIAILNQEHRVIEASRSFAEMLGYTLAEVTQLHTWDWDAVMTEAQVRATFLDVEHVSGVIETRHRRADGTEYDAEVSAQGAMLDGEPVVVTVTRDITSQKRAREIQRARDELYAAVVSQAADGILVIDAATFQLVEFNDAACAALGYSREEFAPLRIFDFTEHDADEARTLMSSILEQGELEFDVRHQHKDGTWRDVHARNRVVRSGGRVYVTATWRDVTELRAQERAAAQERQLRDALLDAVTSVFYVLDADGRLVLINRAVEHFLGDRALEPGADVATLFGEHQEAAVRASLQRVLAEGHDRAEFEFTGSDGPRRFLFNGVRLDVGGRTLVAGTGVDVTDHHGLIEALRETEERARLAISSANLGLFDVDLRTGSMQVNSQYALMLGYDPQEYREDLTGWLQRVHPDDRDRVRRAQDDCREGRTGQYRTEMRLRTRSGDYRWILAQGSIVQRTVGGAPVRMLGAHLVIDERKQAEFELERHRRRLEELVRERTAALESVNNRLIQSDLRLNAMFDMSQRAASMTETELLQHAVDEAARLTGSEIAYMHFVNDDQESLRLSNWSRGTLARCTAAHDDHYPVSAAGIWADTVRTGRPVVHNDYPSASGKKGCPAGHVPVTRHLGVPIQEGGRVRMLLGVGNKPADYDDSDLRELQLIGNDVWRIYTRRVAELQLADAKDAAEAASRAKSTFLANMSHEIRTPLNAITGFAHLVRQSGVTAEQASQLDQVDAAGAHLLQVIDSVLDLAKIEAGKFVLDCAFVDVAAIFANVAAMVRPAVEAKGIVLVSEIESLPLDCVGDPTRLRQALLNYASNAVKFTRSGRITLRARMLEVAANFVSLRVEVEDTGIGVAADTLPRLFTEFEQADNSATRQHRGTGLGLVITRKLAGLMGGDAGATSVPGAGSTFWFTVRLRRDASVIAGQQARSASIGEVQRDFGGRRVLVVEDDVVNQAITSRVLQAAGLVVDIAADGLEAIRCMEEAAYDIVLMDMQMPRMDGPEATRRIRELPAGARLPILAMTANAFLEDKVQCLEAGMDDFITKPVSPPHLLSKLAEWLARG